MKQQDSNQCTWVQEVGYATDRLACISLDQVRTEDNLRRSLGQVPVVQVFGLSSVDTELIFWSEVKGRMQTYDEVGPVVTTSCTDDLIQGIAVWRSITSSNNSERCWTTVIPQRVKQFEPIPQGLINDDLVRRAMEESLSFCHEQVREITKQIFSTNRSPILSLELTEPIRLPSIDSIGTHNNELRAFAFDVYDALTVHFGSREYWGQWEMLPFYRDIDNASGTLIIGVFA